MRYQDYIEEKLGSSERSRMDFIISEVSQELLDIIKKLGNARQIGKAYFGKELIKIEKELRKTQKDVGSVVEKIRQGWK